MSPNHEHHETARRARDFDFGMHHFKLLERNRYSKRVTNAYYFGNRDDARSFARARRRLGYVGPGTDYSLSAATPI
jgi:hypothetical protein